MEKQIKLKDKTVYYTMKAVRQSKRIRLIVHGGGAVVVTHPFWVTARQAEGFLLEKAEWVLDKIQIMRKREVNSLLRHGSQKEFIALKEEALRFVNRRLEQLNRFYGFTYGKVTIRNQKTRWGSCSQNGNLNFHYKLLLLPRKYADYIIVHELCHLKEFNHSKRFWNLVAKTVPNHEAIREAMRNL